MQPELEAVLALQRLDRQMIDRQKDVATLPAAVQKLDQELQRHERKLDADKATLLEGQRERRKLEGDIQLHEQKQSKLKEQMSQAKTNEQYRAFQNEITYAQTEIRKAEDRILALMGEAEPLESRVKTAEAAVREEKQRAEIEKNTLRQRADEDKRFLADLQSQRAELLKGMNPNLVRTYDRIRKKNPNGVVVADATNGRCSACQITIRPAMLQEMQTGTQMQFCESCGRILVVNPAVDVGADAAVGPRVRM